MLDVIQKLLVLQDRDRKILKLKEELAHIPAERQELNARIAQAQGSLDTAKTQVKHLESERKKLELDVEAKKQLIEKYSLQQFQTKKNEEYKALTHEIDLCKEAIIQLDDQQLELMEQIDEAQKQVAGATRQTAEAKRAMDSRLADLAAREENLQTELNGVEANRGQIAAEVDDGARSRYERLMKQKGSNVIVGIQHGVCGGCHMQLNRQVVVSCQADQEIVTCPNCGRILYYTRDMDLAVAE
jgi:predicted  nucleic acid-binding Zn-ribbon protein